MTALYIQNGVCVIELSSSFTSYETIFQLFIFKEKFEDTKGVINLDQKQIVFIIFQPHESYLSLNIIIFTDIQITAWVVEWSSLLTSDHKQDIIYVVSHFDTYLQC